LAFLAARHPLGEIHRGGAVRQRGVVSETEAAEGSRRGKFDGDAGDRFAVRGDGRDDEVVATFLARFEGNDRRCGRRGGRRRSRRGLRGGRGGRRGMNERGRQHQEQQRGGGGRNGGGRGGGGFLLRFRLGDALILQFPDGDHREKFREENEQQAE